MLQTSLGGVHCRRKPALYTLIGCWNYTTLWKPVWAPRECSGWKSSNTWLASWLTHRVHLSLASIRQSVNWQLSVCSCQVKSAENSTHWSTRTQGPPMRIARSSFSRMQHRDTSSCMYCIKNRDYAVPQTHDISLFLCDSISMQRNSKFSLFLKTLMSSV